MAVKQIFRIDSGRFALPRQDDFLWIAGTGAIRREDGLCKRQSLRPLYFRILHRADDDNACALHRGDAGIRIALSGHVSRLHVGFGLRLRCATARADRQSQNGSKKKFHSSHARIHCPPPGDCTEFFHAATADLISAAQFVRGFTKRGVNQGNIPIKSGVTKI